MDFKKKKRGCLGFFERFKSDQSKFEDYYIDFIIENINCVEEWDFSIFPNGMKGRNSPIPEILIQEFPKKFTNNHTPIVSKLSNCSAINVPELLEKLIYFSLLGKKKLEGVILEREPKFEGGNLNPQLTLDEWSILFNEISDLYNFIIDEAGEYGNPLLPDGTCLLNKQFLELSDDKINSVFKTFYLMIGYSLVYGSFITASLTELINEFLTLNAPEKDLQKSGFFSSFKTPKYLYSLDELLNNEPLVSKIVETNIKKGNYNEDEIEAIFSRMKKDPESLLDFILMVLIHYGQTPFEAKNKIIVLKEKLNKISTDWVIHYELSIIIAEFKFLNFLDKLAQLGIIKSKIYSLFFTKK